MTNYQSIPTYQDDHNLDLHRVSNDLGSIPDHGSKHKRYIVGGAFFLLGLLLLGRGRGPSPSSATPDSTAGWIFSGANGDTCSTLFDHCQGSCCPKTVFGTVGFCQTCCTSQQCVPSVEQPAAGEYGKPFCIENACAANPPDSPPIPDDGYSVWLTSEIVDEGKEYFEVKVPRNIAFDEPKPVQTQVWHFDFNEQDEGFPADKISYNATHITIPAWAMIHAGYSRSYHHYDEHETGVVTLAAGDNAMSMVTDYPRLIFVEKYHTLTYDGVKNVERGEIMVKLAKQSMEKPWDGRVWTARSLEQFMGFATKEIILAQVEAGVDKGLFWQLRRYANDYSEDDVGSVNSGTNTVWASHSEKAKAAIQHAKDGLPREYKKSEIHCKHMEAGNGVDFTVGANGVTDTITLPLGRPFVTATGEMVNAPVHYLGLGTGHVTADYDAEANTLELFFAVHGSSRQYSDVGVSSPYPSGLYVSPVAEGSDYVVDKDGRSSVHRALVKPEPNSGFLPRDFSVWMRPRSETCDAATEESDFWRRIDRFAMDNSIFDRFIQNARIAKGVVQGMPCANVWMRPDYGPGSTSFDSNEVGVWVHFLAEVPDIMTKEMGLARWWDDWDCFYQGKDPEICRRDINEP
mmetsp:Transcript_17276/g.39738  ORF Transcript_17276/g.39738 Transcript_17276/m.39738 type:complete len:629 (-) Transcript_17276:222-2108(-)